MVVRDDAATGRAVYLLGKFVLTRNQFGYYYIGKIKRTHPLRSRNNTAEGMGFKVETRNWKPQWTTGYRMSRKKILFVSYFYPPAAGLALPGTQRSLKFVRHMPNLEKYVLTVEPGLYPDYFRIDHPQSVPVADEKIVRTGIFDIFDKLVTLKNKFSVTSTHGDFSTAGAGIKAPDAAVAVRQREASAAGRQEKGRFQRLKDAISETLRYPDAINHWIWPAVKAGRNLIRKEGIEYVFATGKPWSAIIAGMLMATEGVKLIVDFRDPWVDNPFERDRSGVRRAADRFFEKKAVKKAKWVFLTTDYLRQAFVRRYPVVSKGKFITMTNGYDAGDFIDIETENTSPKAAGQHDSGLVITHAGLLYGLRDPIAVFKALALLRKSGKHTGRRVFVFRQLGEITLGYDFSRFLKDNQIMDSFEHVGQVPYRECLTHLCLSDVLLIIQPDTQTQIPSKLYEYIYLNKPILTIAPVDGALGKMVKRYRLGNIFDPQDIEGIAEYLGGQLEKKRQTGRLDRRYVHRSDFDIKNIAAKFESLIRSGSPPTPG
jgi:hypothetical protein